MILRTLSYFVIACTFTIPCFAEESDNTGPTWSLSELIAQAQNCNGDVAAAQSDVCALESGLWEGLAPYSPSIGANVGSAKVDLDTRNESYGFGYLYANWNVFRGGGDRARYCERQLQYDRAKHKLCATLKKVSYDVARAYYRLRYFEEAIRYHEEALDSGSSYIEIANRKRDAGLTTDLDVVEFELLLEEMTEEKNVLMGEEAAAREYLAALLGECEFSGMLAPSAIPNFDISPDACVLMEAAQCHRDDWNDTVLAVCEEEQRCKQAWARYLPSVDIYASYGTEPDNDDERGHGTKAMLTVNFPIFNGGGRYRAHQRSRRQVTAACHRKEQLEKVIFGELKATTVGLETTRNRLQTITKRKETVEKYWTMTREEYRRGVRNSADLTNAANQLTHWRVRLAAAERDVALATVAMYEALGDEYYP